MENWRQQVLAIWGDNLVDHTKALRWIEGCVEKEVSEGLRLEFKVKSDTGKNPNDTDKANLAKAISGFANTDGGVIVWGVKAKGEADKEIPDVAVELRPILNLKHFQTALDKLAGDLADPPVAVENRAVPSSDNSGSGYVVTIVPPHSDTLVQATAKTCKGFYVRSASSFFLLPEVLISQMYLRQRMPILELSFKLGASELREELLRAEHWKETHWARTTKEPWGRCEYDQTVRLPWSLRIRNHGLASARGVEFSIRTPAIGPWEIARVEREVRTVPTGQGYEHSTVPIPWPLATFASVSGLEAFGTLLNPLHPGQEAEIARGVLVIPAAANPDQVLAPTAECSLYSQDSRSFHRIATVSTEEIRLLLVRAQAGKLPPATRMIPEPAFQRRVIILDDPAADGGK